MTDSLLKLSVCIRDLPSMRVACLSCPAGGLQPEMSLHIRDAFQRVQAFVQSLDHDPYSLLTVGALRMEEDRLSTYDCCVQVPSHVQVPEGDIKLSELPGGRYAVLSMPKDPATIGPTIAQLYRDYVPGHKLELDPTRPAYEIYYEKTMDYCVAIR